MFKVYKISYAGLRIHIESFKTLSDALTFFGDHLNHSLIIIDAFTDEILYKNTAKH